MKKYNLSLIQTEYNSGLSLREIQKIHSMSSRTLTLAVRRGDLQTRTKSDASRLHNKKTPRSHTEEFKQSQRKRIVKRYEQGWMPKAGRCKKYKYTSPVAGEVSLDGTWELAVAKWLDEHNYNWKRNTKRFQYINLKTRLVSTHRIFG